MRGVIDYGVGNVSAFLKIYKSLGIPAGRVLCPNDFNTCKKIILPGVGHFDFAMQMLNNSNIRDPLDIAIMSYGMPVLGVCVGMQMMAYSSEEGSQVGLGYLPGSVRHLNNLGADNNLKVPHMGWNEINFTDQNFSFSLNKNNKPEFYFLHSYYFLPEKDTKTIGTSNYGSDFVSIASFENVVGMQCHPEKSHSAGVNFLKYFADM